MQAANEQIINEPNNAPQSSKKDYVKQRAKQCGLKLMSAKFLLVAGIVVSTSFILEGLLCFALCDINVRSYILSFYYIVFGVLSIGAEFRFEIISTYLRILFSYSGRGFWYIFLGTIAIGSEWWAILIALFLIMLGLLNIIAGCQRGQTKYEENDDEHAENKLESESNQEGDNDVNVNVADKEPISDNNEAADDQFQDNSKANPFSDYEDY